MTDSTQSASETPEAAPAKGRGKTLPIAAAGLLAGAVAGTFLIGPAMSPAIPTTDAKAPESHGAPSNGGHGAEGEGAEPHLLENLVVNPADSRGTRFLLFSVGIQMSDAAGVATISTRDTEV